MGHKKDARGGRRTGAGRPPKAPEDKFIRLTVRLLPATVEIMEKSDGTVQEWVRRKAKEDGIAP